MLHHLLLNYVQAAEDRLGLDVLHLVVIDVFKFSSTTLNNFLPVGLIVLIAHIWGFVSNQTFFHFLEWNYYMIKLVYT